MFSLFNKVTINARSGRPIAPIFWKLTGFYLVMAWIGGAILLFYAWLAVRDGLPIYAAASAGGAAFVVIFAHWRNRQITKDKARFRAAVGAYERSLRRPHR